MWTASLIEHGSTELELDDQAVAALRRFPKVVRLTPTVRPGRWSMKARSRVGTLALGRGRVLEIRPKCGVANLVCLLGYAYDLVELRRDPSRFERVRDLHELLLEMFVREVETRLVEGIRRDYREVEEDLPFVRGRLLVDRAIRRPPSVHVVVPCRHEHYTVDVPANQILRFALQRVGTSRHPRVRARARRCAELLAGVRPSPFRLEEIQAFPYDRLTERYRTAHRLAVLLLESASLETSLGDERAPSFLVDMNVLFERYVAAALRMHLPRGMQLQSQVHRSLDTSGRLRIRPDLVVSARGQAVMVADTKYKVGDASALPNPGDAYQALAYCRAIQVHEAALLYPGAGEAQTLSIVHGPTRLHLLQVPLGPSHAAIHAGATQLAEQVFGVASLRRF